MKIKPYLKKYKLVNFVYLLIVDIFEKETLQRASSLAYSVLMSFVPFFISIASICTFFLSEQSYNKLEKFIFENYFPSLSSEIYNYMDLFYQHAGQLSLVSFIFLFITSLLMIDSLSHHLTKICDAKKAGVNFSTSIFINLVLMAIGPIFLSIGIALTSYITAAININYPIILNLLSVLFSIISFVIIYKFIPTNKIRLRYAVVAGMAAGILFELAKRCFVLYIKYFATESVLYGSLATIPIFLFWLYISCLILLGCASIIRALYQVSNTQ